MGRVDLSRHRKTSPSDTPPLPLPLLAASLPALRTHPNRPIVAALTTLATAPTQRLQLHAAKLLAHGLRDAHHDNGQRLPPALLCACVSSQSTAAPICSLAVPVLCALCFDAAGATAGLVATALRGLLACRDVSVPGVDAPVDAFIQRLSEGIVGEVVALEGRQEFMRAAADLMALAAVVAEPGSRMWVMGDTRCVRGALQLISAVGDLFCRVYVSDRQRGGGETTFVEISRTVLQSACNAAMKAAQDIVNALITKAREDRPDANNLTDVELVRTCVREVAAACATLLQLPSVPRSCAVACAVAYVSAIVFEAGYVDAEPQQLATLLRSLVLSRLNEFSPFSGLSLLRAVMEAPASADAVPHLLFPLPQDAESEPTTQDSIFSTLASLTSASADVHFRFMTMDALIACLRRSAPRKLDSECRNIVLRLVYERWHEPFPGISSQIREAMEALIAVDGGDEEATAFWTSMASSLTKGDWHIKGIYAPLNVLVKRLGALKLLEVCPDCQLLAMRAAAADFRLTKAVSDWLTTFWKVLMKQCIESKPQFHRITSEPLLQSLVGDIPSLRERTAEHILPAYFRATGEKNVEAEANRLLESVRAGKLKEAAKVRATVCIMSVARKCGVFVGSFSDPELCKLLREALRCGQQDMRSSALDLVVTCRTSTAPITQEELDLVYLYIPVALMPGSSPSDRSRFRHSMRRFFERIATSRHAARDGSTGWWMRERKQVYEGLRTEAFENMRLKFLARLHDFQRRVGRLLQSCVYPGATSVRTSNTLEVAILCSENLGFEDSFLQGEDVASAALCGFLICLLDEWERPRRAALQLVMGLNSAVANFSCLSDIRRLQIFVLPLLDSPRLKDVDAGASICRFIFRKFVKNDSSLNRHKHAELCDGSDNGALLFPWPERENLTRRNDGCTIPELRYANSLLDSLEHVASRAETDFHGACKRGLFHGRCLVLRHIIQDLQWKEMNPVCNDHEAAEEFLVRLIALYTRCTHIALQAISFEYLDDQNITGRHVLVANANELKEPADDIMLAEEKQVVSTSCFLSIKEICVSMGILCHEVPFRETDGPNGARGLLAEGLVRQIGTLLVHVFRSTRHWGVIDGAEEGLQLLCEGVLKTSSVELRALPAVWVHETLESMLKGKLYVLRRSAGIPSLFAAIVNAEASHHCKGHDTPLLNNIILSLTHHLDASSMFTNLNVLDKSRDRTEESIAHALNLLRSLFLNSNIASYLIKHIEAVTICCVNAFCSASWLIRNSAMMLFSALIRRGIGACSESGLQNSLSILTVKQSSDETVRNLERAHGTTPHQFFSRHPQLYPFLLKNLKAAIAKNALDNGSSHPVLFPTLYLLASLAPSAAEDPNAALSMDPFRAALRECIHWKSDHVRRTAAHALVTLIDDSSKVASTLEHHFKTGLLAELQQVRRAVWEDSSTRLAPNGAGRSSRIRQNHLHGELLTIDSILKETASVLPSKDKISVVKILSECLFPYLWVACDSRANPCQVTRACMISVFHRGFEFALDILEIGDDGIAGRVPAERVLVTCVRLQEELRNCLLEREAPGNQLGLSSFLTAAARLSVRIFVSRFEKREDNANNAIRSISEYLRSAYSEVVQESMTGVRQVLQRFILRSKTSGKQGMFVDAIEYDVLQPSFAVALDVFDKESQQELLAASIRLLMVILGHGPTSSCVQHLNEQLGNAGLVKLVQAAQNHRSHGVREEALILLGQAIRSRSSTAETIETWMCMVEKATMPHQEATSRIAACTSLAKAGLGMDNANDRLVFSADISVRGFLSLSRMLEDENIDVRVNAIDALHLCVPSSISKQALPLDILPASQAVFDLLRVHCYESEVLYQYLSSLMLDETTGVRKSVGEVLNLVRSVVGISPAIGERRLKGNSRSLPENDQKRDSSRLFRLEDDTTADDKMLQLQLVVLCYRRILLDTAMRSSSCEGMRVVCEKAVFDLCEEVMDAVPSPNTCPLEATGFATKGFLRCYRIVLALVIAVSCLQSHSLKGEGENAYSFASLASPLSDVLRKARGYLHPAIDYSIQDVVESLLTPTLPNAMQGVFFLLSP